ncbi:MAG: hypothetical protein LC650_00320 [Actinobacteria bacterium]|nr:hypothetical protein [Actinomycetota bacterium]
MVLPFGTRVRVAATVSPAYVMESDWFVDITIERDGVVLEGSEVPPEGIHRRLLRREADAEGIVLGHTFRIEGEYHNGAGPSHDPYTGEYDDDPSYLVESRRVKVYQIAFKPPGTVVAPAITSLAIPEDVIAEG